MTFEHFALNVADARAMAQWYAKHLRMQIIRSSNEPPYAHFLADQEGRVCVELYTHSKDPVPKYSAQHPLRFHWAFAVPDAGEAKERLVGAGAVFVEELNPDAQSRLIMLRDPWGIPLQICQRQNPMV
jgi:catechol 2,3-dioxygenase-like lactoylglutathione lyase family enzyme